MISRFRRVNGVGRVCQVPSLRGRLYEKRFKLHEFLAQKEEELK